MKVREHTAGILVTVALMAGSGPAAPADTVTALGYWRFEEGVTDSVAAAPASIVDNASVAGPGSPAGEPHYRAGVPGGVVPRTGAANSLSLQFDGANDEVVFDSLFPLHLPTDVTVEFWMRASPSSHQSIFWTRLGETDRNRFNIYLYQDKSFGFDYRNPEGTIRPLVAYSNRIPIPDNVWFHLAIVRHDDTYRVYVNGELKREVIDTHGDLPTSTGWSMSGRNGYQFNGSLDEVRFTACALDPSQFLCAPGPADAGEDPELARIRLMQNSPNPFNPRTTIAFELPVGQTIRVSVYDLTGRRIKQLIDSEYREAGSHQVIWNGTDAIGERVSSGTYFYRVEAGGASGTRSMVLLK